MDINKICRTTLSLISWENFSIDIFDYLQGEMWSTNNDAFLCKRCNDTVRTKIINQIRKFNHRNTNLISQVLFAETVSACYTCWVSNKVCVSPFITRSNRSSYVDIENRKHPLRRKRSLLPCLKLNWHDSVDSCRLDE